jgi:N-acetylglucosamine kinase-like BadF-type ATPase
LEAGGYTGPCKLAADYETAFYGAHGGGPGLVLIAGTGAVCYGMNEAGHGHRCGGWGHIFDDEGSGYALGRDVLAAVAQALDGRAASTLLTDLLFAAWNLRSLPDLVSRVYSPETNKRDIAALAPLCVQAAAQGDPAAQGILDRAAEALRRLLRATGNVLGLPQGPAALMGGLMAPGSPLRAALAQALASDGAALVEPQADAARGAAMMARGTVYIWAAVESKIGRL